MQPFAYRSVDSIAGARAALLELPGAQMIAGGTTLLDLMKAGVERPDVVIDINALPLAAIEVTPERVRIGALARNSDVADDPTVAREFPVLAQALAAGASGQLCATWLRSAATCCSARAACTSAITSRAATNARRQPAAMRMTG